MRTAIQRAAVLCLSLGLCLWAGCTDSGAGKGPRAGLSVGGDLSGHWVFSFSEGPTEFDFCILEIKEGAKEAEAKAFSKYFDSAKLKTSEIKDGQVRLLFESPQMSYSFKGQLDGDIVWGSLQVPHVLLSPAKMTRTENIAFHEDHEPHHVAHADALSSALASADRFADLKLFTKQANRSPLLIEAYGYLGATLKSEKYSREETEALLKEYRDAIAQWGDRIAPRADLDFAAALAAQGIYLDLAEQLATSAQKAITEEYPLQWRVQLANCWVDLKKPDQGLKIVLPLHEAEPSNPQVSFVAARAYQENNQPDQALELYAELAASPGLDAQLRQQSQSQLELPIDHVVKLWKAKHKSTEGIDAYLDQTYEKLLKRLVPKREQQTEPAANSQVALLELYTGSACPPCVAADMAAEAVKLAYSPQELILVKYHVHIPAPDPLALEPSLQRFMATQSQGTPALFLNGERLEGIGGPVMNAPMAAVLLGRAIDQHLKQETPIKIELKAELAGSEIKVNATASGLSDFTAEPRLQILLTENKMHFVAPNGIRIHDAIVRHLFHGVEGLTLAADKLTSDVSISREQLKSNIEAEIKKAEGEFNFQFPVKPLELKHLKAIAFLQDKTGVVLQAALVEIPDAAPQADAKPETPTTPATPDATEKKSSDEEKSS